MSSYVTGGEYLTPVRIHADRPGGRLEIEWADGHRTEFDTVPLRWLCPCAYCRGEAGMPGWLDSAPVLTPEQTQIVDIQLVGQDAVCPRWGDGPPPGRPRGARPAPPPCRAVHQPRALLARLQRPRPVPGDRPPQSAPRAHALPGHLRAQPRRVLPGPRGGPEAAARGGAVLPPPRPARRP